MQQAVPQQPVAEAHPAAQLFPMMSDAEMAELVADIRKHGLIEPIVMHEGLVLDGRNRLAACEQAGVAPVMVEWDGEAGSPIDFVIALNLHRRHLSKSQYAMIANEARGLYEDEAREHQLGSLCRGDEPPVSPNLEERGKVPVETAQRAADSFGVSKSYVYDAARLKKEAPKLAEQVKRGEISIDKALRRVKPATETRARDRHKEVMKAAEQLARLADKWNKEMCVSLAPPQAKKQLTVLRHASDLLNEVIDAVEYRSATLHTFAGR